MENNKTLIISMDGLDKELVEEFDCSNIMLKEYGRIDNDTDICVRVTSELFTSFLTGKTWKDHGIIGLDKYRNQYLDRLEDLNKYSFFREFKRLRYRFYKQIPFVNAKKRNVCYKDYPQPTIFDEIPNSKAIGVRGYNKGYTVDLMNLLKEFGVEEAHRELRRWELSKENELFNVLDKDYDLVMAHFHRADYIHHWYWVTGDQKTVRETYEYMNELAERIKNKAEENGFNTILFMSDHGLPEGKQHNENAFYSSNQKLFGDTTPHITDFFNKIITEKSKPS